MHSAHSTAPVPPLWCMMPQPHHSHKSPQPPTASTAQLMLTPACGSKPGRQAPTWLSPQQAPHQLRARLPAAARSCAAAWHHRDLHRRLHLPVQGHLSAPARLLQALRLHGPPAQRLCQAVGSAPQPPSPPGQAWCGCNLSSSLSTNLEHCSAHHALCPHAAPVDHALWHRFGMPNGGCPLVHAWERPED